ncbi:MAG: type 1 glutamine amidotransferase domain-containing protein [Roseivirga sp.]|nr:type 1 glutamine amidotransferase domain-containing protein [Roseivirga sp.]
MNKKKVLFVITSHDSLGDSGLKTGVWLDEVATPYYLFKDAGTEMTLASIRGGKVPVDPASELPEWETEATIEFKNDADAMVLMDESLKLDDLMSDDYDLVYFPGGHGPMWDFVNNPALTTLLNEFVAKNKVIGALCHGVAVLVDSRDENNQPFVKGKKLTAFSNSEEIAVGAQTVVPFLLESKLKELGAIYSQGDNFTPFVVADGNLVTGQNPASSARLTKEMLNLITDTK